MKLLYKTDTVPVPTDEEYDDQEDNFSSKEEVSIFTYENDEEAEDFELLSHKEQLALCGLKEESTPEKSGTVHRYTIDPGDVFVVIRCAIMSW